MWVYSGMLLGHGKEWDIAVCSGMYGPGGYFLGEVSQTDRDSGCMMSLVCVWSRNDTHECVYWSRVDLETWRAVLWLLRGRGKERGTDWECGIDRCRLLHIRWMGGAGFPV